jgi:predicted small metal-binding protein
VVKKFGLAQELAFAGTVYQENQNGMGIPKMASFMCKDIGIDCPFETQATTHQELMKKFIDHAESAHNMHVLSADIIFRVQNAFKK